VKTNRNSAQQLDALGDATRRAIFERVAKRPQSVGELAKALPVSRPAVSQHLKVLKDAGLLSVRSDGPRNIYAADPAGIAVLRASIERFWRDALVAFKDHAEQKGSKSR